MLDPLKQLELDELIHKLVDGSIGPFEFQRLNDLLMHDKDAQRRYLQISDLVNSIRWQLTGEAMQQSLEAIKAMRASAPPTPTWTRSTGDEKSDRRLRVPTFDVRYVAAAAIVLACTLIGLLVATKLQTAKRLSIADDMVIQLPEFPSDKQIEDQIKEQIALSPRVEQRSGDVQIAGPGVARKAVEVASQVQPGQTVETRGRESSTVLAYKDATSIVLANDTVFTVEKASQKRLTLDEGSMAANVSPQPPSKPMLIRTPHAEIQVIGTRFSVETEPQRTKLSVTEGKVRIRLIQQGDGQWVEVPAGSYALAEPAKPVFVESIPNLPKTWSEDFEQGLPADWDRGQRVKGGTGKGDWWSVKAERIDSDGKTFYQIGSQLKRSDGEGLFQIHPDTHIHLHVRIGRQDWVNFYLATRSTGPVPEYSNYLFKGLHNHIKKHGWYEVTIPIQAFQKRLDISKHPQPNDMPIQIVLSSLEPDRNLTIAKIWVTQGGPGQIVARRLK